jgi:hypothetical protein
MVYPLASSAAQEMAWQVVEWNAFPNGLPPKWFLEEVRVRIYGDANATANNYDEHVYLDGVCPIPPGINPPGGELVTAIVGPWF